MPRMPKRHYVMALACYLAIPAVMIAGVGLSRLIDPEMARASADYARNYRLLELAATGALMATAGLTLALWALTCYLVLKSRYRSRTGDAGLSRVVRVHCSSPCLRIAHLSSATTCTSNSSAS